jgi:hypothetical protein
MKGQIDENGTLYLQSESSLEAYAFKRWMEEALMVHDGSVDEVRIRGRNIIMIANHEPVQIPC